MKIIAIIGSALLAAPLSAQVQATVENADNTTPIANRFHVGETMNYEGKFGFLRLGRASMQVVGHDTIRGVPTTHFRFILRANALGLVRMHNQFDSWVGQEDFFSRRFTQKFNEFGKSRETAYEIFPDSGFYTSLEVDTALAVSPEPMDDTAFFYFVRSLDLEPGSRQEFNNYFRPDRNPVVIEVIERDTIDVPAGRFSTIVVHPIIKGGGIFKESANARMWITDDDRRLIVQMKTKFSFGTVTLRLTDWQISTEDSDNAR